MRKIKIQLAASILLTILLFSASAQQICQATLGSINRATPRIGFNTNGHMPVNVPTGYLGANWTQQSFIDSTVYLNPDLLRYPGGTNANHWDWQTGWYRPGYQPPFPAMTIRVDEFKPALTAANAEGIYVLNMETSNVSYEMDGLRHIISLGITPTLIELGNEHNLASSTYTLQLMTSTAYAQLAKTYYDSIKALLPAAKVCVVGSNTGQAPAWHADILAQNPAIEGFAWHAYLNANNTDLVFNVNRALAAAFGNASYPGSLPNRFQQGGFSALPASKEIWVTEYNLWETQISSAPVIAGTWTHFLYLAALHQYFLTNPKVTLFLNHSLASIDWWHEAISRNNHQITANGIAMKLLMDVSKGSQTCQNIVFSGNPSMTYSTTTIPKLTGWKFNSPNSEKGFICNFSSDTFKISLANVFTNPMQFDSYYADTTFMVNGLTGLNRYAGNSNDSILIYPFSFTQLSALSAAAVQPLQLYSGARAVYPNPLTEELSLGFSTGTNAWLDCSLFDATGKLIRKEKISAQNGSDLFKLNTDFLDKGLYILRVEEQSGRTSSFRLVK